MKTTTADTFPRRYYQLPLGTEFALISGELKTLAELEAEMGTGTIAMGCFYPDADPLRRGFKLRVRETTLAEQYAAKHTVVSGFDPGSPAGDYTAQVDFSDWK